MKIIIYKGKLSEVIKEMKEESKYEAKENKNMASNKKH